MCANVAEIIIFILLGVTCIQEFTINFFVHWNTGLFLCTLVFIIVYRFIAIFGLTFLINKFRKKPIPYNDQILMSISGLRGGIAFSLTKLLGYSGKIEQIHHMLSTCIAIVMFTSFIQGGLISYAVKWLKIEHAEAPDVDRRHRSIVMDRRRNYSIAMSHGFNSQADLYKSSEKTFSQMHSDIPVNFPVRIPSNFSATNITAIDEEPEQVIINHNFATTSLNRRNVLTTNF